MLRQWLGIRVYVWAVACLSITAIGLALGAQPAWRAAGVNATIAGLIAFAILGLLTGALESLPSKGIAGSIVFVSHLASTVAIGPVAAVAAAISAAVPVQFIARRSPIKAVFNLAQFALCILISGSLYYAVGGHFSTTNISNRDFLAYGALVIAYFATNSTIVCGAVAIDQNRPFLSLWRGHVVRVAGYDLVASAVGLLVAWLYLRFGLASIFAVVLPILALRQAYQENVDLKTANAALERTQREILEYTVKQIEARDPYTSGHSRRVSEYARIIADEANLPAAQVDRIATAALLHDVGKVYHEFGEIIAKEGKLSPEERRLLQTHPIRSAELIRTMTALQGEVEQAVLHHHENFDGSGYPDGLKGDQIPIGSRIIMLADTLDAMTTDRPYRAALSFQRVVDEMRRFAGRQFDPTLSELAIRSQGIRKLLDDRRSIASADSSPARIHSFADGAPTPITRRGDKQPALG